jgi:hypothetical protein
MSSVQDLINAIEAGKTRECETAFESLIHAKIAERMEERHAEIRANMFESAEQLDEWRAGKIRAHSSQDDLVSIDKPGSRYHGITATVGHHFEDGSKGVHFQHPRHGDVSVRLQPDEFKMVKQGTNPQRTYTVVKPDGTPHGPMKDWNPTVVKNPVMGNSRYLDESSMATKDLEAMHALHLHNAEKHSDAGVRKSSAEAATKIADILKKRQADKAAKHASK